MCNAGSAPPGSLFQVDNIQAFHWIQLPVGIDYSLK